MSAAADTELSVLPGVSARACGRVLLLASCSFAVVSFSMHLVHRWNGWEPIAAVDVGDEVSIPTLFETIQLLVAGLLALALARGGPSKHARRVRFLGIVLVGLSIDESASIHERLGSALRDVLSTEGLLYYVWVVPAVVFAGAVALWEIPWLRSLPRTARRSIVAAGVLFVMSAGGLELLAGPGDEANGSSTMTSISLTALEELGEMVALSLLIGALLELLAGATIGIRVAASRSHGAAQVLGPDTNEPATVVAHTAFATASQKAVSNHH